MVTKESDEELVLRCRGGDAGAFRVLVDRYQRALFNAAYRVLGNVDDARDVAQIAFMEVAERLGDYDPDHRFFSWIYRIALNAALNLRRRSGREEPLGSEDSGETDPADPESQLAQAEVSVRIQGALMRLSDEHRVVLTLRHFSGHSYREIGLILEIEEKLVKSRLFEARQRLHELLRSLERG